MKPAECPGKRKQKMSSHETEKKAVIASLAADYPLLYLDPDTDEQDAYRRVVLRGEDPGTRSLAHYRGSAADREETEETPAGKVRTVTLGDRHDFELVIRGLMAAKEGPKAKVEESQGAAMITAFNWPRIRAHLAAFPEEEQDAEFKRFTSVRENYLDMLVVLSRGPYSHIGAEEAGFTEEAWLDLSDTIRRFHELTHVICRRQYPGDVDSIRDELIADTVGMAAAFGRFDTELEEKFLGIRDGQYTGGRLCIYTDQPESMAERVCAAMERIRELTAETVRESPYDLIGPLMEQAELRFRSAQ